MKIPSLAAAIVISSAVSAFAITEADITPAALVGKTLTFSIANGGSPYATTGTWTGTFASSGNGFSVANVSGDTVPISTTYSAVANGPATDVALAEFLEGQPAATLTLYFSDGVPKYEVFINGVFANVNGTFTIGSAPAKGPEIEIRLQPEGRELIDGKSTANFGGVLVGKIGGSKIFKVKNSGTSALKDFVITTGGKNKSDFIVGPFAPGPVSIPPGGWVKLKVNFKPKDVGTSKAILHIKSNDKDEASFDIKLTGRGVGIK